MATPELNVNFASESPTLDEKSHRTDDKDVTSKAEMVPPRIAERPLSCRTRSSTGFYDKRMSTASLRIRSSRRKKPRAGDRLFDACRRLPLIVKTLLAVVLTGLPFAIFTVLAYVKYKDDFVGDGHLSVTYKNLAIWLDVAWAGFVVIVGLAECLGRFFSWLCHTSTATVKYAPLAETMWFRLTLIAWVGVIHEATCIIWPVSLQGGHSDNWVFRLREAFEFLTIAFAILLAQGVVLQLIGIQYVQGYIGPRSEHAMDELETLQRLNGLLRPRKRHAKRALFLKFLRKIFLPRESDIFNEIRQGCGTEEEVIGYAAILWTSVASTRKQITRADICQRLVQLGRDPDIGQDLFLQLDRSGDNVVTRQEFEDLVVLAAAQLKKRAGAMRGITLLLRKLEAILCILVFGLIMFIYTVFFNPDVAKNIASLWTGVIALSFAFAGPVAELVNSCVWVFAKHSYDVGDLVEVKGKKLEVRQIFLTHTNFEEAVDGRTPIDRPIGKKVVQVSHSSLNGEVIVNWTRSEDAFAEHLVPTGGTWRDV